MTFGNGMHGALGHGNHNDVGQAKIVEQLIGFEVKQVRNILTPVRSKPKKQKQRKKKKEKQRTYSFK